MLLRLVFPYSVVCFETEGDSTQFMTKTQLCLISQNDKVKLQLWSAMTNKNVAAGKPVVGFGALDEEKGHGCDVLEVDVDDYGRGSDLEFGKFFEICADKFNLQAVELDGVRLWASLEDAEALKAALSEMSEII